MGFATIATFTVLAAQAQRIDGEVVVTETVEARGFDLATHDGALKLFERLKTAARSVCADRLGLEPPESRRACYEDALGRAVESANRTQLSLVYLRTHSLAVAQTYGISAPLLVADK